MIDFINPEYEEILDLARWVEREGYPTGITMFDTAWKAVRLERPLPIDQCPIARQLVRRFQKALLDIKNVSTATTGRSS